MLMVEMVFSGSGGLEELVAQTAGTLEAVMDHHALEWSPTYPVTLREALGLGLQQQIVGGYACECGSATKEGKAYRVWLALPEGGLRGWTNLLVDRVLSGCRERDAAPKVRRDLQRALVTQLGPHLERSELPPLLAGSPLG